MPEFNAYDHPYATEAVEYVQLCVSCESEPVNPLGTRPLCGDCADADDDARYIDGWA